MGTGKRVSSRPTRPSDAAGDRKWGPSIRRLGDQAFGPTLARGQVYRCNGRHGPAEVSGPNGPSNAHTSCRKAGVSRLGIGIVMPTRSTVVVSRNAQRPCPKDLISPHLSASGVTGDPTAPVTLSPCAHKRNSHTPSCQQSRTSSSKLNISPSVRPMSRITT